MAEDSYLSVEDLAKRFGVNPNTIRKYVREGRLSAVRNPVSDSIIGFRESDIEGFLKIKSRNEEEKQHSQPNGDASEEDKELTEIKRDIEISKARTELAKANAEQEMMNRRLASFGELDKLISDNKAKAEANEKQRAMNDELQLANEAKAKELDDIEKRILVAEEERKKLLLEAQNRIARVDEAHKKAREAEDAKRQERHKKQLSTIESLARMVYNPPPQSMSNRLQGQMVKLVENIMEFYGIHPEFDAKGAYVPIEERMLAMSGQLTQESKVISEVSSNGNVTPNDIRACYKACVNVYKWESQEPNYGNQFCYDVQRVTRHLQSLVKDKDDKEIEANRQRILKLFDALHTAIMGLAEAYQDARIGDYSYVADWLCRQAELLEARLGIGVMLEDGMLPLRIR